MTLSARFLNPLVQPLAGGFGRALAEAGLLCELLAFLEGINQADTEFQIAEEISGVLSEALEGPDAEIAREIVAVLERVERKEWKDMIK